MDALAFSFGVVGAIGMVSSGYWYTGSASTVERPVTAQVGQYQAQSAYLHGVSSDERRGR